MLKARLLSTVAATLLIGGSVAIAQTEKPAPERAPAAQQNAPAEKIAPPIHTAPKAEAAPAVSPAAPKQADENTQPHGDMHRATTGQGAAVAARLSTEQRTKIVDVFHNHRVAPEHLTVSIAVGTRLPERIHYYPMPQEIVTIYPEWSGYDYIYVGDQIVVVDPVTHAIVAILEA